MVIETSTGLGEAELLVAQLEQVFKDNWLLVYRVCFAKLHDAHDAEDAAQEVFFRAAKMGVPLHEDPRPWLVQTAKTVCIDEYRRRGRRLDDTAVTETDLVLDPAETDPEAMVLSKLRIQDMLSILTASERRVVAEKWLNDRTHSQASHSLGLSAGTTKVLLSRARRRLSAFVEDRLPGTKSTNDRANISAWPASQAPTSPPPTPTAGAPEGTDRAGRSWPRPSPWGRKKGSKP